MASVGPVSTNTLSQSNLIFALLFIAFLVFITMRGKLPQYLQALIGTNTAATSSNSNSNAGGGASATSSPFGTAAGILSAPDPIGAAATALGAPQILPQINGAASSAIRAGDGLAGAGIFGF